MLLTRVVLILRLPPRGPASPPPQGYRPDEIAVLVPYVGQLMVLRRKLAAVSMTVVVDERDQDLVDAAQEEAGQAEAGGAGGAAERPSAGTSVETSSLGQRVRLSTIDNFKVRVQQWWPCVVARRISAPLLNRPVPRDAPRLPSAPLTAPCAVTHVRARKQRW